MGGKDIVVALSAVFIFWVGAIFFASTRLVSRNWPLFATWRRQDRATRVKMALWLAVPILMGGLAWMRGIAMWHYAHVYGIPTISLVQMLVYLPAILVSLALILWWVCDLTFDRDAAADRAWGLLMLSGGGVAAVTLALMLLL